MSLMMFGRVIFLLYLPATCFSLALFPNPGHETQRRQNPEENLVNVSSTGGKEDPCLELFSPCMYKLRHYFAVERIQQIVVDGRLAVPCGSNLLEESWTCIDSVRQCRDHDYYTALLTSQRTWNFICQNSQAFLAGRDCLGSTELLSVLDGCNHSLGDMCFPTCVQQGVVKIPDCSLADANLLQRMAAILTASMQDSSC